MLDTGAGTSDCSILASGDVILQDSVSVAGNFIDKEIQKYLEGTHYLSISQKQAEEIKKQVGLPPLDNEDADRVQEVDPTITIYGKSLKSGNPAKIVLERGLIEEVIAQAFEPVVELCKSVIVRSSDAFAQTIYEKGLVITGGTALLKNIEKYLAKRLELDNVVSDSDPMKCVIKGTSIYEMHKVDLYKNGYIRPSK